MKNVMNWLTVLFNNNNNRLFHIFFHTRFWSSVKQRVVLLQKTISLKWWCWSNLGDKKSHVSFTGYPMSNHTFHDGDWLDHTTSANQTFYWKQIHIFSSLVSYNNSLYKSTYRASEIQNLPNTTTTKTTTVNIRISTMNFFHVLTSSAITHSAIPATHKS